MTGPRGRSEASASRQARRGLDSGESHEAEDAPVRNWASRTSANRRTDGAMASPSSLALTGPRRLARRPGPGSLGHQPPQALRAAAEHLTHLWEPDRGRPNTES